MDKLISFLKNIWFRRGVAVLCYGYTAFLVFIAVLSFGYHFVFDDPAPVFVLYLFINLAAAGLMVFTRKQVITQVNCYLIPFAVVFITLFAFGNWFIIIPPAAAMVVVFLFNKSNETLKTVIGTIYLLMFVIAVAGYIAMTMFMGKITFTDVDLSRRDANYEKISASGEYRVVRYFDESGSRKTVSYYVEYTLDDVKVPTGVCKKVYGCRHLHTAAYEGSPADLIEWKSETVDGQTRDVPYVEGIRRENPYLIVSLDEDGDK